jgi:hypothetical protein
MGKKVDVCPMCEAELRYDESMYKFRCPRVGCDFIDRRSGFNLLDPMKERRKSVPSAWDTMWVWEHRR